MKRKGKTNRPEILFYSSMIILYLLIVGTLLIYAGKAREASNSKTEQFAERILTDFSINYFLKRTLDYDWLNEDIRGVAIYNEQGQSLVRYGKTPDTLEDSMPKDRIVTEYNRDDHSLIYVRAVPKLDLKNSRIFSFEGGESSEMTFPSPLTRKPLERLDDLDQLQNGSQWVILYLNMLDSWYKEDNQVRVTVKILVLCIPILLALFIIGLSFLFRRFMVIQRQLNEQKNLVILGTAVRTISHEMKNPLGAIYLQIPLINKITGGAVERETGIITSEVERMSSLISWISDFLKEPEGATCVLDLAEETAKAESRFPDELNWHIEEGAAPVIMDPERYRSVLDNIVNNALESGSPLGEIRISLEQAGQEITLAVKDRGKGMGREEMSKVFDPFYTSKSQGSGVGLAVTRRFIEGAGGRIRLHSEEGVGTEVIVSFKRKK